MTNIARSEFERLPPRRRMDLILGGEFTVVADQPRPSVPMIAGALSRKAFDRMSQPDRLAAVKGGAKVVDCDDE
jgi:hypothetical protein